MNGVDVSAGGNDPSWHFDNLDRDGVVTHLGVKLSAFGYPVLGPNAVVGILLGEHWRFEADLAVGFAHFNGDAEIRDHPWFSGFIVPCLKMSKPQWA